jgi:hypothetical protein
MIHRSYLAAYMLFTVLPLADMYQVSIRNEIVVAKK